MSGREKLVAVGDVLIGCVLLACDAVRKRLRWWPLRAPVRVDELGALSNEAIDALPERRRS